jgi:hypothetical protein
LRGLKIWDFSHADSGAMGFHDHRKIILADEFQAEGSFVEGARFLVVFYGDERHEFLLG